MSGPWQLTGGGWRSTAAGLILVAACLAGVNRLYGQDLDMLGGTASGARGGLDVDGELKDLLTPGDDLALLRFSHYSEIYRWSGVAPAKPEKGIDVSSCAWKAGVAEQLPPRVLTAPLRKGEASTVLCVPETRDYRVWLGYLAEPGHPHPVTVSFSGSNRVRHVYGSVVLGAAPGSEEEKTLPVRFEDDLNRLKAHSAPVMIWEYADLHLNAGVTRVALESDDPAVRVDGLFVSANRTFAPCKSALEGAGNLYRTWCRVRVAKPARGGQAYSVPRVALGYHGYRIPRGKTDPLWYSILGTRDAKGFVGEDGQRLVPVGSWTRWVEVTEDVMEGRWARGGGSWATAQFSFQGVSEGACDVQLAWYPHEGAVLKTITPGIAAGTAVCMIPLQTLSQAPVSGTNTPAGVWGMREPAALAFMETAGDVHRRYAEWGRETLAKLGPVATNPLPRLIKLTTGCNAAPADWESAIRMLAALGINEFSGLDPVLRKDLGLAEGVVVISASDSEYLCQTHDPLDPAAERNFEAALRKTAEGILKGAQANPPLVRIKMGDEIGSEGGASTVNGLETCRKAFHDFLRARIEERGTNDAYFGVTDVETLPFIDALPDRPGIHERRLFYECERFKFVLTAMYYAQLTRAAVRVFPRVQTYCNFSPYPPMHDQHMNGSDWFALTRGGGANMAWGEDWAYKGTLSYTGFEVVSYYAAIVECAARTPGGLPAGFYVVGDTGASDRKMFSLLARGIQWLTAYNWGPVYAGTYPVDNWSEKRDVYAEIARATHALGPADALVAKGKREPRRVAVLYNRTHEIWNGGAGGVQTDRLLQFVALSHAHIPAEIILEADCSDAGLAPYRVLYAQGYNFESRTLAALRRWVEGGGILVGVAGTAIRDESNTETDAGEALFGARQRLAGESKGKWHPQSLPDHLPIDTLTLRETEWTPAMTVDVIGVKAELTPTSGQAVGTFTNGACGAVLHALGKGKTLLLGVQPGTLYKGTARGDERQWPGQARGDSRYMLERRLLITKPAEVALGRLRVEYSEPQTEVCLFEDERQIAVTLNNFAYFLEPKDSAEVLMVQTELPIREVVSTLRGPLRWTRVGDRIRVELTAPETVDVILLR